MLRVFVARSRRYVHLMMLFTIKTRFLQIVQLCIQNVSAMIVEKFDLKINVDSSSIVWSTYHLAIYQLLTTHISFQRNIIHSKILALKKCRIDMKVKRCKFQKRCLFENCVTFWRGDKQTLNRYEIWMSRLSNVHCSLCRILSRIRGNCILTRKFLVGIEIWRVKFRVQFKVWTNKSFELSKIKLSTIQQNRALAQNQFHLLPDTAIMHFPEILDTHAVAWASNP